MALSQIQCLDDNHVNPRTHEAKPEFLYCEDQRLALEALLRDGREAFFKYLQERGLRGFLSDPELDGLCRDSEPYDPGLDLFPGNAADDAPPLSLHYWPNLSDTSVPQMDLGWPDCESYRGVTRVTVHTQPPLDGQAHIKEVVRKMIVQAQKVIAVVMDVFTDVDILRDLLDAGYKRRVSVYILLERTTLPHFLSMCQRANMHPGHLKHLRVRCTEGAGFFTRSCTRVKGKLGHRFMFIDGDKALSGSYSFTWMSSRLDRNLATVITGQAVETFDRLFRFLFAHSSSINLREVATDPEPEQEPLMVPITPALPSAALARKLYSPKYALALSGNPSSIASSCQNSLKGSVNTKDLNAKLRKRRRQEESIQEVHPGLIGLEKACMIAYLPTWPEPDPPSDVIGFINIRDASRPTQVHLQRSEMFETSQAIRFSSPFSLPKETLPEVAQPRRLTAQHKVVNEAQTAQGEKQAQQSVVDKVQSTQLGEDPGHIKSPASGQKSETDKDATEALDTGTKLHSHTPTNRDADHNTAPQPWLLSNGTSSPNDGSPSTTTHTIHSSRPEPGSHATKETEPSVHEHRTLQLSILTDSKSNLDRHTQTKTQTHSNTRDVYIQPLSFSEMIPTDRSHTSTSLSEKKHIPVPAEDSRTVNTSRPEPLSCVSSSLTPAPPIPKPRTVQLVFNDDSTSTNGLTLPKISVVRSPARQASPEPPVVDSKPDVANLVQVPQEKDLEVVGKPSENTENPKEAAQEEQNVTSHEVKHEEIVGLQDDRPEVHLASETKPQAPSDLLISDAAKADSVNIPEIILKEVEPKSLTSTDCKISPKTERESEATARKDTEAPENTFAEEPNEKSEDATQSEAHEPERASFSEENPADSHVLETADSPEAPTHPPASAINNTHQVNSEPNQNTHVEAASQDSQPAAKTRESTHTPERPLRPHVYDTHVPDLRSPTHTRELRPPVSAPAHAPNRDAPDPPSVVPDLQVPPPTSDGYMTSREDATPSPTWEEFYECSDTLLHDSALCINGTSVNNGNMTLTISPDAKRSSSTKPAWISNTTSDESQSSSGHSVVSSSSSSPEKVETADTNEEHGREAGEKGKRLSLAEKKTERDSKVVKKRASDDAKKKADDVKQPSEVVKKDKLAQETPKRKRVPRSSSADRQRGGGESISKATEAKQLLIGDLKPERVSPKREKTDKEKVTLRPNGVVRRDRPVSAIDIDRRKTGASSPSRPARALSAPRLEGAQAQENHQSNHAESKVPQERSQVWVKASPPRKSPSRPPPPMAAGAIKTSPGRKQGEVSQQVNSKWKTKTEKSKNNDPSPTLRASSCTALSNSDSDNLGVQQEAEKSAFSFTFGKLYTLRDLKDKMSKLPTISKKSKTSSPGQGRKNTS